VAAVDRDGEERRVEAQPQDGGRALGPPPHEDEHRGGGERGQQLEEQTIAERAAPDDRRVGGGDADPHRSVDARPVHPDRADALGHRIVRELARRRGVGVGVVGHDHAPVGSVGPEVVRGERRGDHGDGHHDDDRAGDEPPPESRPAAFDDRQRAADGGGDHHEAHAARPVPRDQGDQQHVGEHAAPERDDATARQPGDRTAHDPSAPVDIDEGSHATPGRGRRWAHTGRLSRRRNSGPSVGGPSVAVLRREPGGHAGRGGGRASCRTLDG
jgi:hypothetical protein